VTFQVNIPAMRGLPQLLDRRDADLRAALAYLTTSAVVHDISPLYHSMFLRHHANVAEVARFLAGTASYTSADASRVRCALDAYSVADAHASVRAVATADATLPDFPTGLADPQPQFDSTTAVGMSAFADVTTPSRHLAPIGDESTYLPYKPSWADSLGTVGVVRGAIWTATRVAARFGLLNHAVDPIALFLTPFVGDWPGLLRSASAFGNIARVLAGDAMSIEAAHRAVPTVWSGHASDACQCNLGNLSTALDAAAVQIAMLSMAYRNVGDLLHSIMETAAATFTAVVDIAVDVEREVLSLGVLTPIVVPGIVVDFVRGVRSFTKLAQDVTDVVNGGFPPGDPAAAMLRKDTPFVLPAMDAVASMAEIPQVAARPASPASMAMRVAA
jgi:hypothetical protein